MSDFPSATGQGCALEGGVPDHNIFKDNFHFYLRFAEVEIQVLVITLLRKFRLSYHHSPVSIATSFVNKPDRPLNLRFQARCKEDNQSGTELK